MPGAPEEVFDADDVRVVKIQEGFATVPMTVL
jgi:hypothetical protein